jgi:hypothetical protein
MADSIERGLEGYRDRLSDEYKILQDKIDKIGSFRFTIRGWSVTAVIAGAAASTKADSLTTAISVSAGLVAMIWFFFNFELEEVNLRSLLTDRAQRLEKAFIRLDAKQKAPKRPLFPVPFLANEIIAHGMRTRLVRGRRLNRIESLPPLSVRVKSQWRAWRNANVVFYTVLCLLALAPLASWRGAIVRWSDTHIKTYFSIPAGPPTPNLYIPSAPLQTRTNRR